MFFNVRSVEFKISYRIQNSLFKECSESFSHIHHAYYIYMHSVEGIKNIVDKYLFLLHTANVLYFQTVKLHSYIIATAIRDPRKVREVILQGRSKRGPREGHAIG